jgi:hypothetical protein
MGKKRKKEVSDCFFLEAAANVRHFHCLFSRRPLIQQKIVHAFELHVWPVCVAHTQEDPRAQHVVGGDGGVSKRFHFQPRNSDINRKVQKGH